MNLTPMSAVMHATAMGIGTNRFILWGGLRVPAAQSLLKQVWQRVRLDTTARLLYRVR